jgi:error-prone DNA polymerase
VPIIATNDVRCATPADRPLFDVLTCVRHHTTLDAAGRDWRGTRSGTSSHRR